jgi:hypothetical protein
VSEGGALGGVLKDAATVRPAMFLRLVHARHQARHESADKTG